MDNNLDGFFAALADPTRRAVIERLIDGPASVSELAQPHEMALPSFLKHLKVLEDRGLVTTIKRGRVRTVTLQPAPLTEAEGWLARQRALWEGRLDRLEALVSRLEKDGA